MRRFADAILRHRTLVVAVWIALVAGASIFALRVGEVLQGGAEPIPGSPSQKVNELIQERFGPGALYEFLVIVRSEELSVYHQDFATAVRRVTDGLSFVSTLRNIRTYWTFAFPELRGKDDQSTLLLVTPQVATHYEAEAITEELREAIRAAELPAGFSAYVTSMTAMFHDLDKNSSSDLLKAERIGLPITLVILLVVFGAPIAAALPILLAIAAVTISLAVLFFLSSWTPVSLFAENAISMIGLGVGIDYALFIVSRFRQEFGEGRALDDAVARSVVEAGHAVLFSGTTVAIGWLALFLANAPFLHSMALGGIAAVAAAVAASLTLLPALLSLFGARVNWPRRDSPHPLEEQEEGAWSRWATVVMNRPWLFLLGGVLILGFFLAPLPRFRSWNVGAKDLTSEMEARAGYEQLVQNFDKGWMGPTVLLVEAEPGKSVWDESAQKAILAASERVEKDERVQRVGGLTLLLSAIRQFRRVVRSAAELPESLRPFAPATVSDDGRTGLVLLFPKSEPESREAMSLITELRSDPFPELAASHLSVRIGGWTATRMDLDHELYGSLRRIVPAVLCLTFIALLVLFRSIVIPLKATILNLLSVLGAYGFLIYVFQDGFGARWIGLTPPGGLNPFIVVALFTILSGLSMDYEVFLLSRVREEYVASGDNVRAVCVGLQQTAGIISSAALIMVSIFGAFGFTRLIATRQFGLGLAFAVALDATLLRVIIAPALMALAGDWNWWLPGRGARKIEYR